MCNLYSMTKGPTAIIDAAGAMGGPYGNLQPQPGIYPNYFAPIVRNNDGRRELAEGRWGMPSPAFALKGKKTDRGVTNVRNTASPHWRRWLGVEHRCVVPFTSFAEPGRSTEGKSENVWFALSEDRPLAFFAGIWSTWTSVRKLKDGETTDDLFGFLTTKANADVAPIHPKAMPVILTTRDEVELWMTAPKEDALALQRPLDDGLLRIVARGGGIDPIDPEF